MLLKIAPEYPEYQAGAAKTTIVSTTADDYYGVGYQDVQDRNPRITNTVDELDWLPRITMARALRKILETYREEAAAITAAQKA